MGDAREILPTLGRGWQGVDLLLMDPPYGVRVTGTGHRRRPLARTRIAGDENASVGREIVDLAWKNLRFFRHAYVFGPFPLDGLPHASGCCDLVWDKVLHGMGNAALPWGPQHETIRFAVRQQCAAQTRRGGGNALARVRAGTVLRHKRPNGAGVKHHLTEKPVPLLRELIEMSSRHGEMVLDPCVGSGSTLVAAMMEGRRAVGIELEVEWADVAVQRLVALTRHGNPFGELRPGR